MSVVAYNACFLVPSLCPTDDGCSVFGVTRETVTPSQEIISLIPQQYASLNGKGRGTCNSHSGGRKCTDWNVKPRIVL